MRNERVELTADVTSLNDHIHYAGDRGTVQERHTGGSLTVKMDSDGRTNFPHVSQTKPVND